jgi:hypothetical protein
MLQQGQVFKLKAKSIDRQPLWAYRYRLEGRDSARLQVGGFSTRAEAQRALQNKLARVGCVNSVSRTDLKGVCREIECANPAARLRRELPIRRAQRRSALLIPYAQRPARAVGCQHLRSACSPRFLSSRTES